MKKPKASFYAMAVVIAVFAAALALPILRGESPIELGLDLSGGVNVTYRPDFESRLASYADLTREELLALAKETLASRLYRNLDSVPEVLVRGDQTIVVSIPSRQDPRQVLELVGETYHLSLRLVTGEFDERVAGKELHRYGGRYLELAPALFSGDMLDERYIKVESGQGSPGELVARPAVAFRFQSPHDEAFAEFTGDHVGRRLAILLDDRVEWAGTIESAISGSGVLRGGYSLEEASDVAMLLKSGTMPLSLEVEKLSAIGPSLGQEIQDSGLRALLLALGLLAALVTVAYLHRGWFLIAGLVSLTVLFFFIAGMAAAFDLTLDMVGIAGIILSVGMGMDAFIIIFESLESKLRLYKPGQLEAHFDRISRGMYSFTGEGRTLFHANATTLVVILLLFATERLKSFALFILVGVAASVLTIFVTRWVLQRSYGLVGDPGPDPFAWLRRSRPGVFRLRKVYFALLAAGLAAAVFVGPALELGDDFRAGTQLIVSGDDEQQVTSALGNFAAEHPEAGLRQQRLGSPDEARFLVTLSTVLSESPGEGRLAVADLTRFFAAEPAVLESATSIDGKVSGDRLVQSLSVLLLSFFFLAVYFVKLQEPVNRFFSRRAAPAALTPAARWLVFTGILLAVAVDVGVIAACVIVLAIPVNLPVVAAVLTIIGYSVNDSVVLWSHVQNRWAAKATSPALEVVTQGVDRILSRALLTSLSTMVPALTILAVGLSPLEDFARVMIAGTVAGTLSSMFVVGSFAVWALERQARSAVAAGRPEILSEETVRPHG